MSIITRRASSPGTHSSDLPSGPAPLHVETATLQTGVSTSQQSEFLGVAIKRAERSGALRELSRARLPEQLVRYSEF